MTNAIQKIGDKTKLASLVEADSVKDMLVNVANKYITPDRATKIMLLAASRQPKLYECTPASFLTASIKAVEAGLDFGGATGQAYLVPYYNSKTKHFEAQFIPGYQGLKDIVWRVAKIKLRAQVVYNNDVFEIDEGDSPKLVHKPNLSGDRGDITHFYCVAKFPDGDTQFEWMTKGDVDRIRDRSKAKDHGPWVTDYTEMGKKTVVRRIFKYLPSCEELDAVLAEDNKQFEFQRQVVESTGNGVNGLKETLKKQVECETISEPEETEPTDVDIETALDDALEEIA